MKDVDPIIDMYLFEASQMIEQTEAIVLDYDNDSPLNEYVINEIFRFMHTLKGSSAMMQFDGIAEVAHALEDIIHFIRETPSLQYNPVQLINLLLDSIDYFKSDLVSISTDGQSLKNDHYEAIKAQLTQFLFDIKNDDSNHNASIERREYELSILFTDDCQMENIRAYQLVHQLEQHMESYHSFPADLIKDEHASSAIKKDGFKLHFVSSSSYEELMACIESTSYLKSVHLHTIDVIDNQRLNHMSEPLDKTDEISRQQAERNQLASQLATKTSVVSVNVQKLDKLMDLVGELVIAEAMVANMVRTSQAESHNSIVQMNQLSKITSDLQDTIMSIRMVPLSPVFNKMKRITRDMCQKLNKEASIEIIGEETEIDKSVIDQISDPLMHIIRNCIDHGIEDSETRLKNGKPAVGKVTLEAKNMGSDVLLIITDDGRGINKERILEKAYESNLIPSLNTELSDRKIYQFIFHPGLSTKENITEFSGRGVGMDVVASNIESIGGTIYIESEQGIGSSFTIKIPLTLAIIDGMNVRVGQSHFTIPTTSIKESFRPSGQQIVEYGQDKSMVMVRGELYSIIKLSDYFSIKADHNEPETAILLMIEQEQKKVCIQVDELVGQQQVVIKPLPDYLKLFTQTNRLSGCTLLGDGSISIILNTNELFQQTNKS